MLVLIIVGIVWVVLWAIASCWSASQPIMKEPWDWPTKK